MNAQGIETQAFCGMDDEHELLNFSYSAKRFPVEGDVNALFIFVQHKNNFYEDCKEFLGYDSVNGLPITNGVDYTLCSNRPVYETTNCISGHTWPRYQDDKYGFQSYTDDPVTEWPANLPPGPDSLHTRHLPCWANGFIDPPESSQITEGSMTDFYNRVSNGKLNFRGHVWPYTYIPENDWQYYRDNPGNFQNGMVRLSHEIISYVNNNPYHLDFTAPYWDNYTNGFGSTVVPNDSIADGIFDMVVLVFRFSKMGSIFNNPNNIPQPPLSYFNATAIASLGTYTSISDGFQPPGANLDTLKLGNFRVIDDNNFAGSGVISSAYDKLKAIRITAHELGHRHFGFGHTPNDHYSIMNLNNLLSFSALDRIRLGWANILYKEINSISPDNYHTVTLRDAHQVNSNNEPDVLWILQDENEPSLGDVVVEVRNGTTFIEREPDSVHADGDMEDFSLPNTGLYLYKPSTNLAAGNSYSLLNGGYSFRRKLFGTPETDHQGFGSGDAYTPFTLINYNLPTGYRTNMDKKLALTHFQQTHSGFAQFRVWGDFLNADTTKDLTSYYTFESNSIGNTNEWEVAGRFRLLGPVFSDGFKFEASNISWDGLEIMSHDVKLLKGDFFDFQQSFGIKIHSVSSFPTPLIENSTINTGVHVYGSNTNAILKNNTILNNGFSTVYVTGGAYVGLHSNDLIYAPSQSSKNNDANVLASNGVVAFWPIGPNFQGYNRLYGGEFALRAVGTSGTIYAGHHQSPSYRYNSFCDEWIVTLVAENQATILASYNYWLSPNIINQTSNGGSITLTNHLGTPPDCSGMLQMNTSQLTEPHVSTLNKLNQSSLTESESINDALNELYQAIEFRLQGRFMDAYSLLAELIHSEIQPYYGLAVTELLLIAPHIEPELVLAVLNRYHEHEDMRLRTVLISALALFHARNHEYDMSIAVHTMLDTFDLDASERFSVQLQRFYLALDASYTDVALAALTVMEPATELEVWEKQMAMDVLSRFSNSEDLVLNETMNASTRSVQSLNSITDAINYPNPFNPVTTIQYTLTSPTQVTLEVFDILGRRVALLVNSEQVAGTHHAIFDATRMATGMYIYRLSVNGRPAITNTMLLVK